MENSSSSHFETYAIIASPYPRKTSAHLSAQQVCRSVKRELRKQLLGIDAGFAEPTEHCEGIRIYFATKDAMERALKLHTLEVLGTTLRLTQANPHHLSDDGMAAASNLVLAYNLPTDLVEIYKAQLLSVCNWFPNVSPHSIEWHRSDLVGLTALVKYPTAASSEIRQTCEKIDGTLLFGATISCRLLSDDSGNTSAPEVTIRCMKPLKYAELDELLRSLHISGYIRSGDATGNTKTNNTKKMGGKPSYNTSTQLAHRLRFENISAALYCRGLLSGRQVGSITITSVEVHVPSSAFDVATIPVMTREKDISPSSIPQLFLCGFETDVDVIYQHVFREYFSCHGKVNVIVDSFRRLHRAAILAFDTALHASIAHSWHRSKLFGQLPFDYSMVPSALLSLPVRQQQPGTPRVSAGSTNAAIFSGSTCPLYSLRVVLNHKVSVAAFHNFVRRKCIGLSGGGGYVDVESMGSVTTHHRGSAGKGSYAVSYASASYRSDEYRLLFVSKTCPDALTVRNLADKEEPILDFVPQPELTSSTPSTPRAAPANPSVAFQVFDMNTNRNEIVRAHEGRGSRGSTAAATVEDTKGKEVVVGKGKRLRNENEEEVAEMRTTADKKTSQVISSKATRKTKKTGKRVRTE